MRKTKAELLEENAKLRNYIKVIEDIRHIQHRVLMKTLDRNSEIDRELQQAKNEPVRIKEVPYVRH